MAVIVAFEADLDDPRGHEVPLALTPAIEAWMAQAHLDYPEMHVEFIAYPPDLDIIPADALAAYFPPSRMRA